MNNMHNKQGNDSSPNSGAMNSNQIQMQLPLSVNNNNNNNNNTSMSSQRSTQQISLPFNNATNTNAATMNTQYNNANQNVPSTQPSISSPKNKSNVNKNVLYAQQQPSAQQSISPPKNKANNNAGVSSMPHPSPRGGNRNIQTQNNSTNARSNPVMSTYGQTTEASPSNNGSTRQAQVPSGGIFKVLWDVVASKQEADSLPQSPFLSMKDVNNNSGMSPNRSGTVQSPNFSNPASPAATRVVNTNMFGPNGNGYVSNNGFDVGHTAQASLGYATAAGNARAGPPSQGDLCVCGWVGGCLCVCVYIYIYIYIYRERERERERGVFGICYCGG
jgi:hypothetical protein